MKKEWLCVAAVMVGMMIPATVFAAANTEYFDVNGIFYKIVGENAKTVEVVHPKRLASGSIGTSSDSGKIEVPAKVEHAESEYSVVGIGMEAFYKADFTSIVLPEGLEYSNNRAFYGSQIDDDSHPVHRGDDRYDQQESDFGALRGESRIQRLGRCG